MNWLATEEEEDQLIERIARAFVGMVILAGIILLVTCTRSDAHELPDSRLLCHGLEGPWVQEEEIVSENGMIIETYAHEVDGSIGVIAFSIPTPIDQSVEGISHDGVPLFYVIDLDDDGVADLILIDREFTGICSSIVPFEEPEDPTPSTQKEI